MKDDRVEQARETYEWLCSRIVANVGVRPIPAADLDADEARERVDQIVGEIGTDEEGYTYAPSPWHAVLALEAMQEMHPFACGPNFSRATRCSVALLAITPTADRRLLARAARPSSLPADRTRVHAVAPFPTGSNGR